MTKSNGADGISAKMLKTTVGSFTPAVTKLFNMSIQSGKLPNEWKHALVTPIPKPDNKSDPANYRPIFLLSILSKLLEKQIHIHLLKHLQEQSGISNSQWGFTNAKSTLLTAVQTWHQILENGADVCAIFFDIKKAFDSVPHVSLINKLTALNLNPYLLQWIVDYLSNRYQYIGVNGKTSTSSRVLSGVPQGSVLGPLLFLIYINDLTNVELNDGNLLLYADDILLYHPIYCLNNYGHIQQNIDKIYTWSEVNLLQFKPAKCKYNIVVSRKRNPLLPVPRLYINFTVYTKYARVVS